MLSSDNLRILFSYSVCAHAHAHHSAHMEFRTQFYGDNSHLSSFCENGTQVSRVVHQVFYQLSHPTGTLTILNSLKRVLFLSPHHEYGLS